MAKKTREDWDEAKRRCRLSDEAIRMAKELGMGPRALMKNIPNRSEPWKAPVEDWVRSLHEDRFGRRKPLPAPPAQPADAPAPRNLIEDAREELGRALESGEIDEDAFGYRMLALERETPVSEGEVAEENRLMLRRHEGFREAAKVMADALAELPGVGKIVLFGSVAEPLKKEVPRFARLRRARVEIWHECADIDLAVWVDRLDDLNAIRKKVARIAGMLSTAGSQAISVAHHQFDVHLFETGTDRFRGHLCHYGQCPKGKPECEVPGCGAQPFLQIFADYRFDPRAVFAEYAIVLFERADGGIGDEEDIPF